MKNAPGLPPIYPNESIRVVSYCPLCNTQYNPLSARILEEKEGAHLIHIQCRKCGSSIVALIMAGAMGVSSIGLLTDLSSDDAVRLKNSQPISSDDVLSVYSTLLSETNIISYLKSTV